MRSRLVLSFLTICTLPACGKPDPADTDSAGETAATGTTETDTTGVTEASATETGTTEAGATETGTTETGTTEAGVTESGATETTMDDPPPSPACSFDDSDDAICPQVEVPCDPQTGEPVLLDEAALKCALEAFRDRKPGVVSRFACAGAGYSEKTTVWQLRADGTARQVSDGIEDSCTFSGVVDVIELDGPAVYEACLADLDWQKQVECLRGTTLEMCDAGTSMCEDTF